MSFLIACMKQLKLFVAKANSLHLPMQQFKLLTQRRILIERMVELPLPSLACTVSSNLELLSLLSTAPQIVIDCETFEVAEAVAEGKRAASVEVTVCSRNSNLMVMFGY